MRSKHIVILIFCSLYLTYRVRNALNMTSLFYGQKYLKHNVLSQYYMLLEKCWVVCWVFRSPQNRAYCQYGRRLFWGPAKQINPSFSLRSVIIKTSKKSLPPKGTVWYPFQSHLQKPKSKYISINAVIGASIAIILHQMYFCCSFTNSNHNSGSVSPLPKDRGQA